jgi:phospholipid-binding lipoprotein MlaA
LCVIATGAGGCASVPAPEGSTPPAEQVNTRDPFEGFNRAMYAFNDAFDSYLLKPVARVYRFVTPQFVRIGVSNFYSNLRDPGIMVNNLLQGKLVAGASDLGRVAVNTTLGIGGLFDVATHFGLEKHEEDFGQTLAVWGVGEGPYLVLPILGPSNFRDGFGEIPDWYLYPTTYMEEQSTAGKLFVGRLVNRREQLLDATEILEQAAGPDPYVFVREAYRQRRVNLIYDGNPPAPAADPALFDDEPAPGQPK